MFEKVLVALDFSPNSQKILEHIAEIPGIKEVVLLHIVDATAPSRHGWTHDPHIENIKILLAEKKEYLEKLGLTVITSVDVIANVITQGSVPQAIVEAAESHNVSLIIIGARGMNPVQELLLGSVSSTVLRNATMSVLTMRPDPVSCTGSATHNPLFSNVLVPTDFSKPADDVISVLKAFEGMKKIVLLHVVSRAESKPEINDCVANAQARLAKIQKDLTAAGVAATSHVRVGDPTEMILSVAEEDNVSLIAMNAHGTDWLREMLLGSTTFTVVRRTKRPVMAIRTMQET
ncbi:MAG: universal stress protein [Methanoregula sp.]|nr:universal stress protein [Methanoregula sp.]